MVISFHGGEFIKASFGDTTLAFNPVSKDSKLNKTRFGADIALVSLDDVDMNGVEQVTHGTTVPFVIEGPGEYEAKKVTVRGYPSLSTYKGNERYNTIYFVELEGMNLCFLGALGTKKLPPEAKEGIASVDILFVPIGGEGVLTSAEAAEVAAEIEPSLVIPIHYGDIGKKDALKAFLKEEGEEGLKPVDKLTLKKKDLEGKEGEVVVLQST